ncbi:MAG: PorT family protein [Bacteroidales bacterium]|jgi:hypothetical protein|nr:PorT family protein [Bacteroidales bacterium]
MKKLSLLLFLFFAAGISQAFAQGGFGIKVGSTFNKMNDVKVGNSVNYNYKQSKGYSIGVLYKMNLIGGFTLQPELLYTVRKGKAEYDMSTGTGSIQGSSDFSMSYIQLPVGIQYGLDLMLIRPFVQVVPYIGYAVGKGNDLNDAKWDDINRFSYGIGIGGGLDVWKLQINGRYCWDIGKSVKNYTLHNVSETVRNGKNKGFELSLAFIF